MAKKVIVYSGKGGVGKSSVSVCLAKSLLRLGKKVLLIDADVGFKSLDLILSIGTGVVFNWLDVIDNNCAAGNAIVPGSELNPDLLSAPSEYSENMNKENIEKLLNNYNDKYDYIFIDSPAGMGELNEILAGLCQSALLVVTPDAVSVRSAAVATDRILNINKDLDIRLIINRFNKEDVIIGRQMNVDNVIDSTTVQLIGIVPDDNSVHLLPVRGEIYKYPAEAFDRIARRINGESVPLREKDFY